ncbi:MAG: adenylate/guanylate cyclase domain-containing protein [Rectinemataceae bacterium]
MNRLLCLDSSAYFPALIGPALTTAGWLYVDKPEDADALLIDPIWEEGRGYRVLTALRERCPEGFLPVMAILSTATSQTKAFLNELDFSWSVKGSLELEAFAEEISARLRPKDLPEQEHGDFAALLGQALAESAIEEARLNLSPFLEGRLLGAVSGAKDRAAVLEAGAPALIGIFPITAIGIRVQGISRLNSLNVAEARAQVPLLLEAMGPDPDGKPVGVIEQASSYPETGLSFAHGNPLHLPLPQTGGEVWVLGIEENTLIHDLLVQALRILDTALAVTDSGAKLAKAERKMFRIFSRFLPDVVIEELLRKHSDASLLTGEKRQIVALFSHIQNFSHYIEANDPSDIVRFLNRHFGLYSRIIRKHGGSINKYIGDAVFAIFGAPVSHLDNARRALAASIEIQEELALLPAMDIHYPPGGYRAGIGLNEGQAIVGNIGSRDSFDYTAIGDIINLAARLESLCKHYRTRILFTDGFRESIEAQGLPTGDSEAAAAGSDAGSGAGDAAPAQRSLLVRQVDCARVKGKTTATVFHTIQEGSSAAPDFDLLYRKGLSMFRLGNWHTASQYFSEARELCPEDFLCGLYLERCEEYGLNPPSNWDGSMTLGFK